MPTQFSLDQLGKLKASVAKEKAGLEEHLSYCQDCTEQAKCRTGRYRAAMITHAQGDLVTYARKMAKAQSRKLY